MDHSIRRGAVICQTEPNGLTRAARPIIAQDGFSVQAMTYGYQENTSLRESFGGVTLEYFMKPRDLKAQFSIDEHLYKKGRLYLLPPQTIVVGQASNQTESLDVLTCEFSADWLCEVAGIDIDWMTLDPDRVTHFHSPYIEHSIGRLSNCVLTNLANDSLMLAICNVIALELAAQFDRRAYRTRTAALLSTHELRAIGDMLAAEGKPVPTIQKMAGELGISKGHLRQLFRNTTGETLHNRIQTVRMERALALLADETIPLKQVAFLSGYGHHSTFTTAFRAYYGSSPSDHRRPDMSQDQAGRASVPSA